MNINMNSEELITEVSKLIVHVDNIRERLNRISNDTKEISTIKVEVNSLRKDLDKIQIQVEKDASYLDKARGVQAILLLLGAGIGGLLMFIVEKIWF